MPSASSSDVKLEIGHVLFIDIVGYSKLLITEQSERLQKLKEIVWATEQFRQAQAEGKLLRLPTGDGGALVFRTGPEAPVLCALEISKELRKHPEVRVRMGIHSGPVNEITDLNEQANIAGAGINIAQRVMDCGDAGHILLSRHVAEDLEQYPRWRAYLHDLGECEVKHGVRIHAVNFYTDDVGNQEVPEKFRQVKEKEQTASRAKPTARSRARIGPIIIGAALIAIGGFYIFSHQPSSKAPTAVTGPTLAAIPEKSIAVLPFENLSSDKENAYFADGIHDEILTRLSKIADLKVISRTSSARYKSSPDNLVEIANKLGVANILEGSVQRTADQVRVNVQLIKAGTDAHVWAETYDRKLPDVFAIESDIAKAIADTLQVKLTGSQQHGIVNQPTESTEAHDLYLKGRFYWNKRTVSAFEKSIEYFNQAIERDPTYALAYTGLADCYMSLGFSFDAGWLSPNEAIPRAKAATLKALKMDDSLAEAHTSLAFIKLNYDWDWSGAEREFKRAIELNPNYDNAHHWYSHYLTAMGRTKESLAESKRALLLDQLGLVMNVHLGWHYFYAHQYDLAIEQFQKTLEMDANYGLTHWYLGMAYEQTGNYRQAIEELQKGKDLLKENVVVEADMGHAYAVSGNREEARKALDQLKELSKQRYVSSYLTALIYTGLGERDHAFEWLEKAYQERSDLLVYLKVEPRLDSLRSDARFKKLVELIFSTKTQ